MVKDRGKNPSVETSPESKSHPYMMQPEPEYPPPQRTPAPHKMRQESMSGVLAAHSTRSGQVPVQRVAPWSLFRYFLLGRLCSTEQQKSWR